MTLIKLIKRTIAIKVFQERFINYFIASSDGRRSIRSASAINVYSIYSTHVVESLVVGLFDHCAEMNFTDVAVRATKIHYFIHPRIRFLV